MRQRKKKKAFKKRFGFNPPRNISIQMATRIMEYKEYIIATFERLKAAILDLWESIKKPALELAEAIKAAETGKGTLFLHNINGKDLEVADQKECKQWIGKNEPDKYIKFFGEVEEG